VIELRWMKLKSAAADVKPVLQYRQIVPCVDASMNLCPGEGFTSWQEVPLVFVEYSNSESGDTHSDRYGD